MNQYNQLSEEHTSELRRTWVRRFLFCTGLAGFCITAFFAANQGITPLDDFLCSKIYALRNSGLTAVLTAITYTGNWQSVSLICILLLFFQKTRRTFGIPLTLSAMASVFVYEILKRMFERPRPDLSLHLITQGGYSFPSGHSMTGLVFYGLLVVLLCHHLNGIWLKRLLAVAFTAWIALIGFSRVYLGVHYPTDILGGWFLGTCILCSFSAELQRRWQIRERYHRESRMFHRT